MWLAADARGKYADEIAGLWLRVKESYGDEWEQVRTRLLDDLETKTTLACIRAEERWDDLMDAIERLDLYRDQLLEHCPDRLIAAYVSDLRERAKLKRSSRQLYRDFVDRARTVRDLPGGREVVGPLVAGMRERNQSRPALLEELDRL